ncbi:3-deoxy-D-manno-octulosonic-acid transferase [Caenispirillum salinarum AK4]|uniref:3-deoxy-D-manno-octulosonic acid transferase n=1 Tax=Caenispirillum salinarum AK4 TaxID=1238182 RepID=K9HQD5_9PROT|nr:3-deoxy-D-manno-octulosonic acid transferase [Caenispirillum salinarum]EKV32498.1 3-deoxy-D-manno-octulosonic-acid transferase [Caenispirillum salinarum AK4]
MLIRLYRGVTTLGGPLIDVYLSRRMARGKEDQVRFPERRGRASQPRPAGGLVWIHAASVGESLSLLPLVHTLRESRPGLTVLVTTGTVTSAKLMTERLPDGALHQYFPVDRLPFVRRFLNHWKPDLVLWAESEFWPNMIMELRRRAVPMVLVNGRVSDKSFRNWQRFQGVIRQLLGTFTLCLGQTEDDTRRLRDLGAPNCDCLGNLKFAAQALPADEEALTRLHDTIGNRPVWLAASTHAGEELIAGQMHHSLADKHPGLLTIIVPRHAHRGDEVRAELEAEGLAIAQRSRGEMPDASVEVYIADTMGELGLFYRLAPVVFIGKSLAGQGGQNPLEAARLSCAVVLGPNMDNFAEMTRRMVQGGAAKQVGSEGELRLMLDRLLSDGAARATLGTRGHEFATQETVVLERILDRLAPLLDAAERGGHARP